VSFLKAEDRIILMTCTYPGFITELFLINICQNEQLELHLNPSSGLNPFSDMWTVDFPHFNVMKHNVMYIP
jgi:hypothetical protein